MKVSVFIRMSILTLCALLIFSCGDTKNGSKVEGKKIILGFSQIGSESGWRIANTKSIQDSAKESGIELIFSDAQQKQENQLRDLRSFISQKVDVISFSPVVATGWDAVLQEAKAANIPVILTDRTIDTKDESLYVSLIGSDFNLEGKKSAQWLGEYLKKKGSTKSVSIVELRGTDGSAPAIERKKGFEQVMKTEYPNWKIVRSESADFTRAKGKEVMTSILKKMRGKFNVLYAHNDDMALGAIEAIEKTKLKPGKDIIIVSLDATKGAFEAMIAGKLNCTVECSPLLGPQLMNAVKDVAAGKKLEKRIITIEGIFPAEVAEKELPNRKY